MQHARRPPPAYWPLALGVLLALAVYLPRLNAPLAWDDLPYIRYNSALKGPIPFSAYASPEYFRISRESSWRPLATLSYWAMLRALGERPWALRLPGLALHLVSSLLAFLLFGRLGAPKEQAAWGSALFLVHPAHVETLMCVSFNEDLLVCAGLLAMLLAHLRGRTGGACAAFAAALLSKETGAAGLPLALALDALRGGRPELARRRGAHAAYAALLAAYLYLRLGPLSGPGSGPPLALPLLERLLQAAKALATSARIFGDPVALRIEYFALPLEAWEGPAYAAAAAALLAGAGWALLSLRRREPAAALAVLWPFPFLAAVSPLLPANQLNLRLTAERFLYVPAAGLCALVPRFAPRAAAAGLLALWTCLAAARAGDWSNETRLWEGLLRLYPESAKAAEGLGEAYLRAGRPADAAHALEAARRLREGRLDPILRRYVPLTPELAWDRASVYRSLGLAYVELGYDSEARRDLLRALDLDPTAPSACAALSYLAARDERFREARAWAERGLSSAPDDPVLRMLRDSALRGKLSVRVRFR